MRSGPLRGMCLACCQWHVRGQRVSETTRHMVLDCPDSQLFWDLLARALLATLSTADTDQRRACSLAVTPLLSHMRLSLLSGLASPVLEHSGRHGTAFRTACHEALAALVRRRHLLSSDAHPPLLSLSPLPLYTAVHAAVSRCASALLRDAHERESMIRIRHPGWEPPESGNHPVGEWDREWPSSGMTSGDGVCVLPRDPSTVPSSWSRVLLSHDVLQQHRGSWHE